MGHPEALSLAPAIRQVIISHRHQFIFFSVPKTATRALRHALASVIDVMDWQQQNLQSRARLPIERLAAKRHGHISVSELQPHLPDDLWQSYFKFAFVRHPFERFVSTCFFLYRNDPDFAREPTAHMKMAIASEHFRERNLILPQSRFLVASDGRVAVDYVGRYESLQACYDKICRRVGIPTTILERRSAVTHGPYTDYFDQELLSSLAAFYRDDLENFGYQIETSTPRG